MKDVYDTLKAAGIGSGDSDSDGYSNLDELFIAHGFFADNGNQRYDPGEEVGRAAYPAKPDRRNTPDIPGAYLLVKIENKNGSPVSGCTLTINVEYEPPNDYHNYSYEVELAQATGNMVGLGLSPASRPATARIIAKCPGGGVSQEYWAKVEASTTGYAEEVTFEVDDSH